ncbi:MAG TPA: histone deacetylase [Gemmatimonadales bacterium]|nr:histone deacetylase [Gemmatimonadales bacterium]
MAVAVYTHPSTALHDAGPGHPEAPARIVAVLEALRGLEGAELHEAPAATVDALRAVHTAEHLQRLADTHAQGGGRLDPDTVMNAHSWEAMLGATGAVLAAADRAHAGTSHAFAAVRPPGHHALADRVMGFCLVNNAVVAARHFQSLGRRRALIIDWDVHHGNGTQALVEADDDLRFVSLHQSPWWPFTGAASERGVGNIFNVPMPPGLAAEDYVRSLWRAIEAATTGWMPEVMIVSAGFDAMAGDPLGGFTLEPRHYRILTERLRERMPAVPILGTLEGGYVPGRLAKGVAAHVLALA